MLFTASGSFYVKKKTTPGNYSRGIIILLDRVNLLTLQSIFYIREKQENQNTDCSNILIN